MIRIILLYFFLFIVVNTHAQKDTVYLKSLYDHCLTFDETHKDSLHYYALQIEKKSKQIGFKKGNLLSSRLMGIYKEMDEDLPAAVNYYLQSLTYARLSGEPEYEVAALGDLGIAYKNLNRLDLSKKYFTEAIEISKLLGDYSNEIINLNNLGAIYNLTHNPELALKYYRKSQEVAFLHKSETHYPECFNNIGNVYFSLKKYPQALEYFRKSYALHLVSRENDLDLYLDHLNLSDTYISLGRNEAARLHADSANYWSQLTHSKVKHAEVHALFARYFASTGNYDSAFERQKLWYTLDTALLNLSVSSTVAAIQEKFDAHEREEKNQLLGIAIEKEKLRNKNIVYALTTLVIVLVLAGLGLLYLRALNRKIHKGSLLIQRQNQNLISLNEEKDDLIKVVSHDLNTPFAAVELWGHLLLEEAEGMNASQVNMVQKILDSGRYGQELIKRILDVGKLDEVKYEIQQEAFSISALLLDLQDDFLPAANAKEIVLEVSIACEKIVSDRLLLRRILENLISNAIKYSHSNTKVTLQSYEEDSFCVIEVKDEGLGISAREVTQMFRKYGQLSNKPTAGESSSGMGLYIVKQLVEQLQGQIQCTSTIGVGTTFFIKFPIEGMQS